MPTNYGGSDESIRTFLTAVDMTLRRRSEYEERQIRLKQLDNQMQEQVAKSQVDVIGAEIAKMKAKFDGEATILGLAQQDRALDQGDRRLKIDERNATTNEINARALLKASETGLAPIDLQAKARGIMEYDLGAVASARKEYTDAVARGASVYSDALPDIIGRQYMVTAEDGVNMVIGKNAPILSSKGPSNAFSTWRARGYETPDRWLSETTATAEKYMTTFGMLDGGRVAQPSGGHAAQYGYAFAELEGFLAELAGSRDASKVAAALAAKKAMRDKIDSLRDPGKTGKPTANLKPDDAEAVLQAGLDSLHDGGAVRAMWTSSNMVNWNADMNTNLGGARPMTAKDLLSSVYGQYSFMISGNGGKMWQAKAMSMEEIAYRQRYRVEAEAAAERSSTQYNLVMSGDPSVDGLGISRKTSAEVSGGYKGTPSSAPIASQLSDAVGAVTGALASPQVDEAINGLSLFNPESTPESAGIDPSIPFVNMSGSQWYDNAGVTGSGTSDDFASLVKSAKESALAEFKANHPGYDEEVLNKAMNATNGGTRLPFNRLKPVAGGILRATGTVKGGDRAAWEKAYNDTYKYYIRWLVKEYGKYNDRKNAERAFTGLGTENIM